MQRKPGPELFFGLVGPLGTDLDGVYSSLSKSLERVGYSSEMVIISESFSEISGLDNKINHDSELARIESSMDVGDEIRDKMGGNATAILAMNQIRAAREIKTDSIKVPFSDHAYVIRSLKHADEVKQLRNTYGKSFWLISAYLPQKTRIDILKEKGVSDTKKLVDRDYAGKNLGQNVIDTFPAGDVFVDASSPDVIQSQMDRFIDVLFGYPFHTPYREEYGMFHAFASSLRSASLSRQVGAAILDKAGNLISTGTNEVPKAGGGVYAAEDKNKNDHREFRKGYDSNQQEKLKMLEDVFERLKTEDWLSEKYAVKSPQDLVKDALGSKYLKGMHFMDLTEYGREVHAEMDALVSAARGNESVKECTMYCTTFPCHICAKHIVSSGINSLVFIEPYPKSHASKLFDDSISVGDVTDGNNKVYFKPYFGISPSRYIDLFTMLPRKDKNTGKILDWNPLESKPRFWNSHHQIDEEIIEFQDFVNLMREKNLEFKNT
ncbi:MAG: deoxycytidylate deaminase [Nitrosopumilus sp. B06]|nr:MAG: deoxycytidylate deaminase [Nitrosopumilus sp. D6]RNJ80546.1 MAG: deoxycytidylate deaminase [Nitrosopumilus sp. B06]